MYRHAARLDRLEDRADPKPKRRPDPAAVGTPREREYLQARTTDELEAMEPALIRLQDGGDIAELDPATVALMDGWIAAKRLDIAEGHRW